jgi:hypothetical protein
MKLEPHRGHINSSYKLFETKHSTYLHNPSLKIRRQSQFSIHMVNYTCIYTGKETN